MNIKKIFNKDQINNKYQYISDQIKNYIPLKKQIMIFPHRKFLLIKKIYKIYINNNFNTFKDDNDDQIIYNMLHNMNDDDFYIIILNGNIKINLLKISYIYIIKKTKNYIAIMINYKKYNIIKSLFINFIIQIYYIRNKNNITHVNNLFMNLINLKYVNIDLLITDNMNNFNNLFYNCNNIDNIDLTNAITNNITDMSYMFYNCYSLKSLPDISNWNINKVSNKSHLFSNCDSLPLKFIILIN